MAQTREIKNPQKPVKGLLRDYNPINQPPNTYRFSLNSLLESKEGDFSSLISEEGNSLSDQITEGYVINGSILINDNFTVIFSTNGIKSEIGIFNSQDQYSVLISSSCLNFSDQYPIIGRYKIHNGCERIIYFTDNYNPIRSINLDSLISYTELDGSGNHLPVLQANATDRWNCNLMKFNPDYSIPQITLNNVQDNGGNLERGTYFFCIRYLDSEFNPTGWTQPSGPMTIYSGSINGSSDQVDGGNIDLVNSPQFAERKSIVLNLNNLDRNFPYYQLGVIESKRSTLNEAEAFILPVGSIDTDSTTYVYTGEISTKTTTSVDDLVINQIVFDKVKTIDQVDNRLFLANTSTENIDWSVFQRTASKIITNCKTTTLQKELLKDLGGHKSSTSLYLNRSYMRDEIYALGIVYVFNDGSQSPVFHIPGRPADSAYNINTSTLYTNNDLVSMGDSNDHTRNLVSSGSWDKQLITVVPNGSPTANSIEECYVAHIPETEYVNGNQLERWKVYNTGIVTNEGPGDATIIPSYYEGISTYKDIADCNGDSIWGTDFWGNTLANTPIRHHKLPDTTLIPHASGWENDTFQSNDSFKQNVDGEIFPITFVLGNIQIPVEYQNEVQGYYIVHVERKDETKTVLDKGMLGFAVTNLQGTATFSNINANQSFSSGYYDFTNKKILEVCSPNVYFSQSIKDCDYIKTDRYVLGKKVTSDYYTVLRNYEVLPSREQYIGFNHEGFVYLDSATAAPGNTGLTVQGPINGVQETIVSSRLDIVTYAFQTSCPPDTPVLSTAEDKEYYYVSVKNWVRPYENLFDLFYVPSISNIETSSICTSNQGDIFISELTFKRHIYNGDQDFKGTRNTILNLYCESDINSALRSHGTQLWETHIRYYSGWINSWYELPQYEVGDGEFYYNDNYFRYEDHYSQNNNFKTYFPLPIDWDYCSECEQEFPHRIWYSERSYQEERQDNYRNILANNYQDLLGASGEVTFLFVYKDQLYCTTKYSTWQISTRPQQLTTNESNIEIGTGDVFQIPPRRLESVDRGYAGSEHILGNIVTEFGSTIIDSDVGKIFLLSGKGLADLTLKGMRNWFAENLPITLLDRLPDFNTNSFSNKNGIGFKTVFDPRHNRLIIHKKDYKLLFDDITLSEGYIPLNEGEYGLNLNNLQYYSYDENEEIVYHDVKTSPELFEDLSWTISYSMMQQSWSSFHSYRPDWSFSNRDTFYTFKGTLEENSNYIWEHGTRNYGNFYEFQCPTVVDLVYNHAQFLSKVFNSIQYVARVFKYTYDDKFTVLKDETFDKMYIATHEQSSGELIINSKSNTYNINPFVSVDYSSPQVQASRNEETWSISEFYDLYLDYNTPTLTSDWNGLDQSYRDYRMDYGIIETVDNSALKNSNLLFDIIKFRGKYIQVRLWYSNTDSNKMVLDFVSDSKNITYK